MPICRFASLNLWLAAKVNRSGQGFVLFCVDFVLLFAFSFCFVLFYIFVIYFCLQSKHKVATFGCHQNTTVELRSSLKGVLAEITESIFVEAKLKFTD